MLADYPQHQIKALLTARTRSGSFRYTAHGALETSSLCPTAAAATAAAEVAGHVKRTGGPSINRCQNMGTAISQTLQGYMARSMQLVYSYSWNLANICLIITGCWGCFFLEKQRAVLVSGGFCLVVTILEKHICSVHWSSWYLMEFSSVTTILEKHTTCSTPL